MVRMRSTSPPKSAWPGVSMMLILVSVSLPSSPRCFQRTEVFLARMVMPRSFSRSLESITRSATTSLSRKTPLCLSMASTRVVLPWSTWATMATLRRRGAGIWAARTSTRVLQRRATSEHCVERVHIAAQKPKRPTPPRAAQRCRSCVPRSPVRADKGPERNSFARDAPSWARNPAAGRSRDPSETVSLGTRPHGRATRPQAGEPELRCTCRRGRPCPRCRAWGSRRSDRTRCRTSRPCRRPSLGCRPSW